MASAVDTEQDRAYMQECRALKNVICSQVLASSGDNELGGDDLDRLLVQWLLDTQLDAQQADAMRHNAGASAALLAAVEAAKVQLSSCETACLQLPSWSVKGHVAAADGINGSAHNGSRSSTTPTSSSSSSTVSLSRQQLQQVANPWLQRLQQPLSDVAAETHVALSTGSSATGSAAAVADKYAPQPRRLTAALLVGGATRMPAVRQFVHQLTGMPPW